MIRRGGARERHGGSPWRSPVLVRGGRHGRRLRGVALVASPADPGRRAQSAERRAAQARLVAGWAEDLRLGAWPFPEVVLRVRNGSELPVYEVSIRAAYGVVGTFVQHLGSMGPDETRELRIQLPAPPRADPTTPEMQFTDAGQRRWLRDAEGAPRELGKREVVLFTEDAGAYDPPSEHPTLGLALSPEQRRGWKVQ